MDLVIETQNTMQCNALLEWPPNNGFQRPKHDSQNNLYWNRCIMYMCFLLAYFVLLSFLLLFYPSPLYKKYHFIALARKKKTFVHLAPRHLCSHNASFKITISSFLFTIVNWVEWLWNPSDSFVICFCGPESAQRSKEFLSFWLYWPIKTLHQFIP